MLNNHVLTQEYWSSFEITKKDIDFLYNFLLEKETPQPASSLVFALIDQRIKIEKKKQTTSNKAGEKIYFPKDEYSIGDNLIFPKLDNRKGIVAEIRDGFNPDIDALSVITVDFEEGEARSFASGMAEHQLNHLFDIPEDDLNYDPDNILAVHGEYLIEVLESALSENEDLVKIAGNWFPRSLLVDVHIGHLNLVEAILEESKGGPIGTLELMNQIDLNANADKKLLEFSLDLALQEDERFDEVGPAGETLWFLHVMEPESVRKTPLYLKNSTEKVSAEELEEYLSLFDPAVFDELESKDFHTGENSEALISLSYPHWRAGTLPLPKTLARMFPTAYEAPRVKFSFMDGDESFPGWVVRTEKYVVGLQDWYEKNDILPGSLIKVRKGKKPGEISVSFEKSRQNKEWLKTVLVGSDNGIVFAMLKQPINADFNERMALVVTDVDVLDEVWKKKIYLNEPIEKSVNRILRELIKLNPQGQVHAQEIYASVNVIRRCPPSSIIKVLRDDPAIEYLGDLYFRYKEKGV